MSFHSVGILIFFLSKFVKTWPHWRLPDAAVRPFLCLLVDQANQECTSFLLTDDSCHRLLSSFTVAISECNFELLWIFGAAFLSQEEHTSKFYWARNLYSSSSVVPIAALQCFCAVIVVSGAETARSSCDWKRMDRLVWRCVRRENDTRH